MIRPAHRSLFVILVAAQLGYTLPSMAQDLTEQEKASAKEHYDKGRAAYDKGNFDEAIKELKQAYMASRRSAILFNIGQTYKQLGDNALALHFFQKFLAEADATDPNRGAAQQAVEELQAAQAAQGGATPAPSEGETPAEEQKPALPDFRHVVVGEAPPRHPVDLKIKLGDDAADAESFLYYRGAGQEEFSKVPFAQTDFGLVARLPKKAMSSGKSVQYYIETRKADGSLYGNSGSAAKPNVMAIDRKAQRRDIAELSPAQEDEPAYKESKLAKMYRPAKWVTAGASALALGIAAGYGAYGARLTTDIEKKARESSVQLESGSWSTPENEYDVDLEDLDQKGRNTTRVATAFGITGGVLAVVSGTLFYLDWRRGKEAEAAEDVAFAPVVGPDFGGAAGILRF